jgi:hypothetical protein
MQMDHSQEHGVTGGHETLDMALRENTCSRYARRYLSA